MALTMAQNRDHSSPASTPRDMANPPLISVVTCSYNQGRFIGDTIESVLAQNHPRLEHIVVDGGSRDETKAVCDRYPHVRFVAAAGTSQTEALNIGFREAAGDIMAWLNSDDCYARGTFARVAREIDPSQGRHIVAGAANVVDERGNYLWQLPNGRVPLFRLLFHPRLYPFNGWTVMPCQPAVFFHREVLTALGPLDTTLRYAMDYEFWLRALVRGFRFHYVPQVFALYRIHGESLTSQGYDKFLPEWTQVALHYYSELPWWKQFAAECWWLYARAECFFVRRHKAARDYLARQFAPSPSMHPWRSKLPVLLRAISMAPWYPIALAWQHVGQRRGAASLVSVGHP